MPCFTELVIEFSLNIFGDVRVIRRTEALKSFNDLNDSGLGHLRVHVISLDPYLAVSRTSVNLQSVSVVTCNHDGFGTV